MEIRIGNGYDIHKLVNNKPFIIGNINIPYKKGFLAHSDGDVLIHSIIDALFGASNLGDIGTNFSDKDQQYKNIDSRILLEKALEKVKNKNYSIINIDCTIICQKPKLMKYIISIREKISQILKIDMDQISVKAKTKEGLDAVGKGKAVEAFSSCILKKMKKS